MKIAKIILPLFIITFASQSWASEGKHKRNMMKALDADGDGAVSFQEFQNSPDKRFQRTDINNDGFITLNEMEQHHAEREAKRETERQSRRHKRAEKLGERFTMLDVNGDGTITLEEAQRGIFDRLDSNSDGVITRKEAKKARKHHKRHRRSQDDA